LGRKGSKGKHPQCPSHSWGGGEEREGREDKRRKIKENEIIPIACGSTRKKKGGRERSPTKKKQSQKQERGKEKRGNDHEGEVIGKLS